MRIAQVAPLAESVPPKLYGGTSVRGVVIEELVELGHDVTLFASGDSVTRAKLVSVWPRALRLGRPSVRTRSPRRPSCSRPSPSGQPNSHVVHVHIDWLLQPRPSRIGVPFITTPHGRMDLPGFANVIRPRGSIRFDFSITSACRSAEANWVGTVYHGLPVNFRFARPLSLELTLPFSAGYCLRKAPDVAIRIARAAIDAASHRFKIAARRTAVFQGKSIEPQIDGDQVAISIGEVNDETKESFLAGAAALVFPIDWPEPFGLVMILVMAFGTPVIAFRSGSVPEVVEDGLTGFIVDGEVASCMRRSGVCGELDRRKIRARFEQRFTAKRMAERLSSALRHIGQSQAAGA